MGVPGFFIWLLKKVSEKDIILENLDNINVDIFYIDANCAFHPQCFKVLETCYEKDTDILENLMIDRILKYLQYLINFVKPKKEIYIAVDGIAPMAKLNQQRKRRYKSLFENKLKNQIKNKYKAADIGCSKNDWSNTAITPGTNFMEKLHEKILEYIKTNPNELKIKFTYSSYHTPGEGEHKILQDIKKNNKENTCVIYGLDADLIFLSMASEKKNIYLLRESLILNKIINQNKTTQISEEKDNTSSEDIKNKNQVDEELYYVCIDTVKIKLNELFRIIIRDKYNVNFNDKEFINDFIFICYLVGNDFLPNIPSIEIKNYGMENLITNYCDIFHKLRNNILYKEENTIKINYEFLKGYFYLLARQEGSYFEKKLQNYEEYKLKKSKLINITDAEKKEMWDVENMNFDHIDIMKKDYGIKYLDLENIKYEYYAQNFYSRIKQKKMRETICKEYIIGINWITKYYFEKCRNWNWQYIFNYSPLISDLYHFIETKNNMELEELSVREKKNKYEIKPLEQLLSVIPPNLGEQLLPLNYYKLMLDDKKGIKDMFPQKIKLDGSYKDNLWKCIPLVPNIDIEKIKNAARNEQLRAEEEKRNTILKKIIYEYK